MNFMKQQQSFDLGAAIAWAKQNAQWREEAPARWRWWWQSEQPRLSPLAFLTEIWRQAGLQEFEHEEKLEFLLTQGWERRPLTLESGYTDLPAIKQGAFLHYRRHGNGAQAKPPLISLVVQQAQPVPAVSYPLVIDCSYQRAIGEGFHRHPYMRAFGYAPLLKRWLCEVYKDVCVEAYIPPM